MNKPAPGPFKDYFSALSGSYRSFRPHYPAELFEHVRSIAPAGSLAWDCASGNGQAATMLARHFSSVIATDASAQQIAEAEPRENVVYRVETAEATSIDDATVDLTTVAQALHWFDLDRFADEVRRVSVPGAVLAVWSYAILESTPAVDAVIETLYNGILGDYWTPERRIVERGYADVSFPFEEIPAPVISMQADWSLEQLIGYLSTWSAGRRYEEQHGEHPLALVQADLAAAWGDPGASTRISWPLTLRHWRVT